MPFTFSHPALIFPIYKLRKKWFSITGLIVGSITPDFEYFFRMKKGINHYSHTIFSILYFNLPVALLLAYIFHAIVRKPLINHLPTFLYRRFYNYYNIEWKLIFYKRAPIFVTSIVLGSISHIAWDGLTHYVADLLYTIQHKVFFFSAWMHHSFIYSIIHFTFSFIGLAFLAILVIKIPVDKRVVMNKTNYNFWLLVVTITVLIFIIRVVFCIQLQIGDLAVSFISAFLLSIILSSLYFTYK